MIQFQLQRPMPMLGVALIAGLAGCAMEEAGTPDDTAAPITTRERLADGAVLEILPSESSITVGAFFYPTTTDVPARELPVRFGTMHVATTNSGRLVLEDLDARMQELEISPSLVPPDGVRLTDVRVQLVAPIEAEMRWYYEDQEGYAEATIDLRVEWSYETSDGQPLRLAPQHVEGVVVGMTLGLNPDGTLRGRATAELDGPVLTWPGFAELRDLRIELEAGELVQ